MKHKSTKEWALVGILLGLFGAGCAQGSGQPASPVEPQAPTEDGDAGEADEEAPEEEAMEMDVMMDMRPPRELTSDGSIYVQSEAPNLPRVRFPDGQVGASDSCAVRMGNKLSRKVPPAYVNGQPIGFC